MIRAIFGRQIIVKPQAGLLLIMRGDRCLHAVRPVLESKDRINIVMAYDYPDSKFPIETQLNSYLYNSDTPPAIANDPNYY